MQRERERGKGGEGEKKPVRLVCSSGLLLALQVVETAKDFNLADRALHVYSEAKRVLDFEGICADNADKCDSNPQHELVLLALSMNRILLLLIQDPVVCDEHILLLLLVPFCRVCTEIRPRGSTAARRVNEREPHILQVQRHSA